MSKSTIEWTEETWNPVRGCSRISPGCVNCYAERMAARFCAPGEPFDGFVWPRNPINEGAGPMDRNPSYLSRGKWTGKVELIPSMLDIPLRRKKPTTYFVNSMSDLFHEDLPTQARRRVFDVMREASWHTYQILTKRGDIMRDFMQWWVMQHVEQPPANWLLGVSVEDQHRADERIPLLLQTPAAVRFLSVEPLLGPVSFRWAKWHDYDATPVSEDGRQHRGHLDGLKGIDWCIVGGESGPGARPCDVAHVRSIVEQCKAAGVACFVKQLGALAVCDVPAANGGFIPDLVQLALKDRKGGEMSEWPADLRVRQMPEKGEAHRPDGRGASNL